MPAQKLCNAWFTQIGLRRLRDRAEIRLRAGSVYRYGKTYLWFGRHRDLQKKLVILSALSGSSGLNKGKLVVGFPGATLRPVLGCLHPHQGSRTRCRRQDTTRFTTFSSPSRTLPPRTSSMHPTLSLFWPLSSYRPRYSFLQFRAHRGNF